MATSCFKFEPHKLQHFELKVDSQPIVSHPLKMKQNSAVEFYCNYLKSTNRFYNVFANGGLSYENYRDSNFLIYTNLKQDGYTHGQLTLKLRFATDLPKKLFLLFMPVFEKQLIFDSYLNPSVQA